MFRDFPRKASSKSIAKPRCCRSVVGNHRAAALCRISGKVDLPEIQYPANLLSGTYRVANNEIFKIDYEKIPQRQSWANCGPHAHLFFALHQFSVEKW